MAIYLISCLKNVCLISSECDFLLMTNVKGKGPSGTAVAYYLK